MELSWAIFNWWCDGRTTATTTKMMMITIAAMMTRTHQLKPSLCIWECAPCTVNRARGLESRVYFYHREQTKRKIEKLAVAAARCYFHLFSNSWNEHTISTVRNDDFNWLCRSSPFFYVFFRSRYSCLTTFSFSLGKYYVIWALFILFLAFGVARSIRSNRFIVIIFVFVRILYIFTSWEGCNKHLLV